MADVKQRSAFFDLKSRLKAATRYASILKVGRQTTKPKRSTTTMRALEFDMERPPKALTRHPNKLRVASCSKPMDWIVGDSGP
mmetsp:Transcript_72407/g.162661  ORF Transcript_72407/g.162661 Transcript_72407/m.162661 type:complete len:83 (+) Transcript_72407:302-550(+)